jgi:arsenate reductase
MKFYQYSKCSTCKKAEKWLGENRIDIDSIDIVQSPPSKTALKKYWKASGLPLQKFFNTSGQSYRQGNFKEKLKTMSDDDALSALAADGKLIKRPLLSDGKTVLVGFKNEDYQERLLS